MDTFLLDLASALTLRSSSFLKSTADPGALVSSTGKPDRGDPKSEGVQSSVALLPGLRLSRGLGSRSEFSPCDDCDCDDLDEKDTVDPGGETGGGGIDGRLTFAVLLNLGRIVVTLDIGWLSGELMARPWYA
jgi:hypothetical protein